MVWRAFSSIFILGLFGAFWLSAEGFTPIESLSASLSMLANVGPSLGQFGPAGNYNAVSDLGKFVLSSMMVLGRLELLTVLVLFTHISGGDDAVRLTPNR